MPVVGKRSVPSWILRYGFALLTTALATGIRVLTMAGTGPRMTFTTFVVAVILTSWYGGLGPALLALALGTVIGIHYSTNL